MAQRFLLLDVDRSIRREKIACDLGCHMPTTQDTGLGWGVGGERQGRGVGFTSGHLGSGRGILSKSPRRTIVQHGGGSCSDLRTIAHSLHDRAESHQKTSFLQLSHHCLAPLACNPKLTRRSACQIRHMPSASTSKKRTPNLND